jgi:hypothetical protein
MNRCALARCRCRGGTFANILEAVLRPHGIAVIVEGVTA